MPNFIWHIFNFTSKAITDVTRVDFMIDIRQLHNKGYHFTR